MYHIDDILVVQRFTHAAEKSGFNGSIPGLFSVLQNLSIFIKRFNFLLLDYMQYIDNCQCALCIKQRLFS